MFPQSVTLTEDAGARLGWGVLGNCSTQESEAGAGWEFMSNKPGGSFLREARILNDLQVVIWRLPKEGFDKSQIVCLLPFHCPLNE